MYSFLKRFLDIALSLFVLIVLIPLFIRMMMDRTKIDRRRLYIIFKKTNHGKNSKYFDIWKFATMLKNSPNIGTGMITIKMTHVLHK